MTLLARRITVALLVLLVFVASAVSAKQLVQLNFLHRHGARQEPPLNSWDNCCYLTSEGAQMAVNLGNFLRAEYGDFFPKTYDYNVVESRSTDLSRTIQTGYGVLRGLFGVNGTYDIPFLDHVPEDDDSSMVFPWTYGNYQLEAGAYDAWKKGEGNTIALKMLTTSELEALGVAVGDKKWCLANPMQCAMTGSDYAQCRRSNSKNFGGTLKTLWDKLMFLRMEAFKFTYGFPARDSQTTRAYGSYGWTVADGWMRRASAPAQYPKIQHLSAHDTTVLAVLNTLQNNTRSSNNTEMWVPKFAATIIVEVYDDKSLQFRYAMPSEEYGSGFQFSAEPLFVGCLGNDGTMTMSSTCSVEDAWRSVNLTAPTTNNKECYLAPGVAAKYGCDQADVVPKDSCLDYREACPSVACSYTRVESVLDRQTFSCMSLKTPPTFGSHAAAYILGSIAALLLGLALGKAIDYKLHSRSQSGSMPTEYTTLHAEST